MPPGGRYSWAVETDRGPAPLADMRVLDLSRHVAGPYCTKLLADFGADVTKVEPPDGDPARRYSPGGPTAPGEESPLFLHLNTSKRSVTLNLNHKRGQGLLARLLARSDALVHDYAPAEAARLGVSSDALCQRFPRLVVAAITSFGLTGPERDRPASDLLLFARSAVARMYGDRRRTPLKQYGFQAQYLAGLTAATGVMLALRWRRFNGRGQVIDVSILEAMLQLHEDALARHSYFGEERDRAYNRRPGQYPHGFFPCADGHVAIAAVMPQQWDGLALLMGRDDWRADPSLQTAEVRDARAAQLDAPLRAWLRQNTRAKLTEAAQELRTAVTPVLSPAGALKHPQLAARGYFDETRHPRAGKLRYAGLPFRLGGFEALRRPAPALGEDNDEVYQGLLGIPDAEMRRLRAEGAL